MSKQLLSNAYQNFVIHCRNKHTRQNYESRLKKFLSYCQVESYDNLLFNGDLKLIQTRITDFLIHLQGEQNLSPATVSYYLVAIRFFYNMNDVIAINWGKISKVLPEFRKVANDRPYSVAEISKLLERVDHRGRIIILLMASSGMREGAIHSLKLSDVERLQDIYKITVYKNDPAEYYTFCSPECAKAIDDYLEYRKRYGEVLNPSAPLLRQRFNKLDPVDSASPKVMGRGAIQDIIYRAINDCGLREKRNLVNGEKRILHEVMQSHGLRKFFNTQVVMSGMPVLYAEMLMGHRSGLAMQSYVKPTVAQMLEEYLKVVDAVTVNEENKLRRKVTSLTEKQDDIKWMKDKHEREMKSIREEMNKQFTQVMEMIRQNPQLANVKPEVLTKKQIA